MRGKRAETWGAPCFSLFWEEPRVNVPGGFQAQCNYEKEATEKSLVFWTCSAEPVAFGVCLLSPFLVIFHLKTVTLTLTPHKERVPIGLHLRELTVT